MTSREEERIAKTRDFLISGTSICPFANKYASQTSFGYVNERFEGADLSNPVLDLARKPEVMAAVYVFDSDLSSHVEERGRAVGVFKELFKVLYIEEHGMQTHSWLQEADMELDQALSPDSGINPFMCYQGQLFFSIAMNPAYERQHPRWAPVSLMALTRHSDVLAVPQPIVKAIRSEMAKRTGSVYDADQLYLMP